MGARSIQDGLDPTKSPPELPRLQANRESHFPDLVDDRPNRESRFPDLADDRPNRESRFPDLLDDRSNRESHFPSFVEDGPRRERGFPDMASALFTWPAARRSAPRDQGSASQSWVQKASTSLEELCKAAHFVVALEQAP